MARPEPLTLELSDADWFANPERVVEMIARHSEGDVAVNAENSGPILAQTAQILLAAKKTAEARGATLKLEKPSGQLCESLRFLGLHSTFLGTAE